MGVKHDKLWTILHRAYTDNAYIDSIVDSLIPKKCTSSEVDLLSTFYINIIKTDALLYRKLDKKDPYNMYNFLPSIVVIDSTRSIDFEQIKNNIKSLNILPSTRDYDLVDILLQALSMLIESL